MAGKSEDDYWFASEKKAFIFDDECSLDSMIDKTANQKHNFTIKEDNFTVENEYAPGFQRSVVPIGSVMSPQCLERLLDDTPKSKAQKGSDSAIIQTINNILLGKPHSLEEFKSLQSKTKLLDVAIENADGNAILTVVLFLSKTLKKNIFFNLLSTRKVALMQYINYLTLRLNTSELTDLLMLTGYSTIIGIKLFKIIINNLSRSTPPEVLHKKLQSLYNNHFSRNVTEKDSQIIKYYLDLLEWQINVTKEENMTNVSGESVNKSLSICCQFYWDKSEEHLCSPKKLSKLQNINDRQLHWIFLDVKTIENSWDEIIKMFIKNNWFGTKKVINSSLNAENIIILLGERKAPSHILETFLSLMDDSEKSLSLAIIYKCHRHVINYYVNQKDRISLLNYKSKIAPQSEDYFLIGNALSSATTKWKN